MAIISKALYGQLVDWRMRVTPASCLGRRQCTTLKNVRGPNSYYTALQTIHGLTGSLQASLHAPGPLFGSNLDSNRVAKSFWRARV